jgi:hypothetical protein
MEKVVKLATPITLFGKPIREVRLREPKGGEYARLGEPRTLVFSPTGGYWVEDPAAIAKYIDACLVVSEEVRPALMPALALDDAMEVKAQVLGFFTEAAARIAARKSTSSSST